MSRPRSKQPRKRVGGAAGAGGAATKPFDVWDAPSALPEVRAVTPATDPTSLLRSLGDAPLAARGLPVDEFLFRAVIKASQLAGSVAHLGGLYAPQDDDD